ncbi:transposase [Flavobacterium marginilacus]|uniref:transposase n=1 Tax=Flavobacterium marginilacus TaxID=3003256 RepID=UPI00248EC6C9|nr:transposase [Flavobacterium marginilacus]
MKDNPFLVQNLFYNIQQDFYVCPMGQRMENIGSGKRTSANGYESQVSYYQVKRCHGCPLRGLCHQAKGNRTIEINHRLNQLRAKAKELLTSEKGLEHRSKRPIEVEAVFGQLKNNNKFSRFTFTSIEKVEMEFLLMAIGHNFRKMIAKNNDASKTHLKISFRVLNRALKDHIYLLNTVTEYFFINQPTQNRFLKFAA